jgi:hypothetical protein
MTAALRSGGKAGAALTAVILATVLGACGIAQPGSTGDAPTVVTTSGSVAAPPTPTFSPSPAAAADTHGPPSVAGYAYVDEEAGSAVPGMAKALVDSINQSSPGFVTGHFEHGVLRDGEHVLNLLLLRIDMAAVGDLQRALFVEGVLQWAVGSAVPQFSELTLAGQWVGAAHVTVDGEERAALVWPGVDTIAVVVGRSQPEAEAFLTGLIKAYVP